MMPLRVLEALQAFSVFRMFSLVKELHWCGVTELKEEMGKGKMNEKGKGSRGKGGGGGGS